ncbi:MAG: SHD1 domain-containing protein [Planctomycetota bacterium]
MHTRITTAVTWAALSALLGTAYADQSPLLTPPPDAPRYRLSNLRVEDDRFGRAVLVFDYQRTGEGHGRVRVAGRSADGPLHISFSPSLAEASGEVRLSKTFSRGGGFHYEFYLVVPAVWAGERVGQCLVSNTVRIGEPGPGAPAREWTEAERAAYEKHQLADTPPADTPEGHVAVGPATPLAPGMPVKAGRYAEWVDAELLAVQSVHKVVVRFPDHRHGTVIPRSGWLAVDPAVLELAKSDPQRFSPSLRVLASGGEPLPANAVAVPRSLPLPRGVPLLRRFGLQWETVYVVRDQGAIVRGITAKRRDFFGSTPAGPRVELEVLAEELQRDALAIERGVLKQLESSAPVDFAGNLKPGQPTRTTPPGGPGAGATVNIGDYHVIDRDYPVCKPVPGDAQLLPEGETLAAGSAVAYFWGRGWRPATLILDEGATVVIQEANSITKFAYRVPRRQVIIRDAALRTARDAAFAEAAGSASGQADAAAAEPAGGQAGDAQPLRTWTDSTGKHKVEARFIKLADGRVVLRAEDGRRISLPLSRLSTADRALAESLGGRSDNPFE